MSTAASTRLRNAGAIRTSYSELAYPEGVALYDIPDILLPDLIRGLERELAYLKSQDRDGGNIRQLLNIVKYGPHRATKAKKK